MSDFGTLELWTTLGTVVAAIAAAIAAIMSYQQVRLVRAADVVASLYFVGNLHLALKVTNHGGVARRMTINYEQVDGPKVIILVAPSVMILNGVDVLARSETREWEIGEVPDPRVFTQDHQRAAMILEADETRQFERPFTLRVDVSWDEPGIRRRRSEAFNLIADRDLYDRSLKKQSFAGLPDVG